MAIGLDVVADPISLAISVGIGLIGLLVVSRGLLEIHPFSRPNRAAVDQGTGW